MGGVLAELLAREGRQVTLVTPAAHVSAWTSTRWSSRASSGACSSSASSSSCRTRSRGAAAGAARVECVYTGRERELACDALVLVTARLPNDGLGEELLARRGEWAAAGVASVRIVGDAYAPGTIASAVWDGHRFAEELDGPEPDDAVPYRREVDRAAAAGSHCRTDA